MKLKTTNTNDEALQEILAVDAVEFVGDLCRRFASQRRQLLIDRESRDFVPGPLEETRHIREDASWRTCAPASDYLDRRVEITGPTARKMVINALNSGACGFMADFEDANAPTWVNQVGGQRNVRDAAMGTIEHRAADGRVYRLGSRSARLIVRPRGWHLDEHHATIDGEPVSGALFDFGMFAVHSARVLLSRGFRPYLYLPKIEHHREAALWAEVLAWTEDQLGIERGSFRATVLIETLPAVFQMEEILFALREHSAGLNAGRWDYLFSALKKLGKDPSAVLPDRSDVTMTVPFMRSYTEALVATCHARGTFAMGGMAALVPNRKDPDSVKRAIEAVRADKRREATAGFDGTWVAHPDVVEVAREEFDAQLGDRPNQIVQVDEIPALRTDRLVDLGSTPGAVTEAGLRSNLRVAFLYISNWLTGRGAVAIDGLMEDAATAEIARTQVWQWLYHGTTLADGRTIDHQLVEQLLDEECDKIRADVGNDVWMAGRPEAVHLVLREAMLGDELPEFLTTIAYPMLVGTVGQAA